MYKNHNVMYTYRLRIHILYVYKKHTKDMHHTHQFFKNTCLFDIFFCVLRGHLEHSLILSTKIRNIKKSSF
jgi:hypothetical protein